MRIYGITHAPYLRSLSFERRLRPDEEQDYKDTIQEAKTQLELSNVAMIVHGSSFPSKGVDSQIGSPYGEGANEFLKFLQLHGFNNVQLGPAGEISREEFSPYESKVFARNRLFIDLKPLMSDEYAGILSEETYKNVSIENFGERGKNYNYTNYFEAFENYDTALEEAYLNFKRKLLIGDEDALKLNAEFTEFKQREQKWLEKDGIFNVLSAEYGTDDFSKWENPLDRELPVLVELENRHAIERYNKIKARSANKINQNSFIQFIADKQLRENAEYRKEIGFFYINDLLVGFSNSDMWANQDAFMADMRMGCPDGGPRNGPQHWGIPVLNPDRLFNSDGSLDIAGQLLKDKIDASLNNFDNLRVDHALGLVDPYIYDRNNPGYAGNISRLDGVDKGNNFRRILEEIVIPTFREHGLKVKDAVWEDICAPTPVFNEIYRDKFKMPGLSQLEWMRGEGTNKDNWALVGSHDSIPASMMNKTHWDRRYLAGYLHPDNAFASEREEFERGLSNPVNILRAKFIELFRSTKNIQISFADFFGIDKVYNHGGNNTVKSNWKLRVNNDYQDTYYKSLEDRNSNAICMPEIMRDAVKAKRDMLVAKLNDQDTKMADAFRVEIHAKINPLIEKLNMYAEILREPSQ